MPVTAKPYPKLSELSSETLAKFWSHVQIGRPQDCWPWLRGRDGKGYGAFAYRGRVLIASRLAWAIEHGSVPQDMQVLHTCDNPPCCNPRHHYLGSHESNVADRVARKRQTTHRGASNVRAKLTAEQVAELLDLYHVHDWLQRDLAERYGISQRTVSAIVRRESYREVEFTMPRS
jgi:hypothetical protein